MADVLLVVPKAETYPNLQDFVPGSAASIVGQHTLEPLWKMPVSGCDPKGGGVIFGGGDRGGLKGSISRTLILAATFGR